MSDTPNHEALEDSFRFMRALAKDLVSTGSAERTFRTWHETAAMHDIPTDLANAMAFVVFSDMLGDEQGRAFWVAKGST